MSATHAKTTHAKMFIAIAACAPLWADAQQPEPFRADELQQVTATVESVNTEERTAVIVNEDGERTLVAAGPKVRNFEQIEPGDRVVASYYAAIAAEVKPKGEGAAAPEAAAATARAPEGSRPGGAVGATVATTVVIDSVDRSFDTVTFTRPDGIVRTVAVEDPDAKRFIRELKPGDEVQIRYTEAVAVNLEPAQQ